MKTYIKFLGSLAFALWLIGGLIVVLVASTLLESAHGTPFAQRFFYQAGWFDVFLALFWVNIFCASLSRWPFKRYHTGFLVVHAGILMILAGSLLGRYWGVDGQMALYEKESQEKILLQGFELVLHTPDHQTQTLDLGKPSKLVGHSLFESAPGTKFVVKQAISNASVTEVLEENSASAEPNRGIDFTLKSGMIGLNQRLTLIQHHPSDPSGNILSMGMASFELQDKAPSEPTETASIQKPRLVIKKKDSGESFSWDLESMSPSEIPLGSTGLTLKRLRYLPDARVNEDKELVSVSDNPANPAVEFTIEDAKGQSEFHTRFALFPDFESLHGKTKNDLFHLEVELLTPQSQAQARPKGTGIVFFPKDGRLAYHSHSSKSPDREDFVEVGKEMPAGWMDFSFVVNRVYEKATISKKVTADGTGGQKADLALEIAVEKDGREISRGWLLSYESLRWETPKGPILAAVRQRSSSVPFTLTLKDFRKVDYPGTSNAASYESDVLLEDKSEGVKIEKTIKMNKPLDYKGYRIFQSSFSQDPTTGETSVFTIAKNPGIGLIYWGSVVMCVGIVMVFYVKPLSSFSARGSYVSKKP